MSFAHAKKKIAHEQMIGFIKIGTWWRRWMKPKWNMKWFQWTSLGQNYHRNTCVVSMFILGPRSYNTRSIREKVPTPRTCHHICSMCSDSASRRWKTGFLTVSLSTFRHFLSSVFNIIAFILFFYFPWLLFLPLIPFCFSVLLLLLYMKLLISSHCCPLLRYCIFTGPCWLHKG